MPSSCSTLRDEPFRLPQSQVEHEAQRQHQLNPKVRVTRLVARHAPTRCSPPDRRRFLDPKRQVSPPTQSRLVGRPIRDPVARLRNVVAARGVVLERHRKNIPAPPGSGYPDIHAPTPESTCLPKKLSNSVFDTYDTIVDCCRAAWNWLTETPDRISTVAAAPWAKTVNK